MENTTATIEKLIEKAEVYSKTTLKLYKFNAIYKAADISSLLAIRVVLLLVVVISLVLINFGLSLFIGQKLGEIYYGFFIVAFAYLCVAIIIYIFRNEWIKTPVSDFIIDIMKNENEL